MKVQEKKFLSIEQLQDKYLKPNKSGASQKATDGQTFHEILENSRARTQEKVKFSKHAAGRLADRNIELTNSQIDRLQQAAEKAQLKGIKESLVIVDQLAFIVNIPNNTVVTALNNDESTDKIFTNIDGAVII